MRIILITAWVVLGLGGVFLQIVDLDLPRMARIDTVHIKAKEKIINLANLYKNRVNPWQPWQLSVIHLRPRSPCRHHTLAALMRNRFCYSSIEQQHLSLRR